MATLTPEERAALQQFMARKKTETGLPIEFIKAAVKDGGEAFLGLIDGTDPILDAEVGVSIPFTTLGATRVNNAAAVHGVTFTNPELKWLGDFVFNIRWQASDN